MNSRIIIFLLLAGCANNAMLPTPNSPKTAGVEALVAYGLAASIAHQYLVLPVCTTPPTALCKKPDIAAKVLAADTKAHDAAIAADDAANADLVKNAKANTAIADLEQANKEANGGKQ